MRGFFCGSFAIQHPAFATQQFFFAIRRKDFQQL
jgi:hypothetical protein